MIFKLKVCLLTLIFLVFSFNTLLYSVSMASTDLEEILHPFTQHSSIHFTYTEIRTSIFFKNPQVSTGEIRFIKPDKIIKAVLKPEIKNYEISQNKLIISSPEKPIKELRITDYPHLKRFIDLIKNLLSGDVKSLRENYRLTIKKMPIDLWELNLNPRRDPAEIEQRDIKSILIKGRSKQIKTIKMIGFGGEVSELRIESVLDL